MEGILMKMVLAITKMYRLKFAIVVVHCTVHREYYTLSTQHLYILFVFDLDYIILIPYHIYVYKYKTDLHIMKYINLYNIYFQGCWWLKWLDQSRHITSYFFSAWPTFTCILWESYWSFQTCQQVSHWK